MAQKLRNSLIAFLCTFALGTTQAQTLSDSLIAHFPMDGSPNDLIDGLAPTLTQGTPGFCADRFGNPNNAACFDGNDFWSYGDVLDMDSADFTIACWLLADTVHVPTPGIPFSSSGALPISKGTTIYGTPSRSGYSLMVHQPVAGQFRVDGATGDSNSDLMSSDSSFELDQWKNVVLSRCGTHQLLYVDGILVADSITVPGRNLNTNIVFTLGALNRDPTGHPDTEFFTGALDDVRIYKGRCLSQAEIDTLAFDLLTVGVAEPKQPALTLSPNPVRHLLNIAHDKTYAVGARCLIMDGVGRTIKEQPLTADRTVVDVMDIPPGAYFVKLQATQWQAHGKFIKE